MKPGAPAVGWTLGGNIKAEEKGIDVKLSIDAVMMAVAGKYDIAIVASADSDLVPVAEALLELKAKAHGPAVEGIAWRGAGYQKKLGLGGKGDDHLLLDHGLRLSRRFDRLQRLGFTESSILLP